MDRERKEIKQAIVYCRFSPRPQKTKKDVDGNEVAIREDSNEKQNERCLRYCERKEYLIFATEHDEKISGKTLDRPGLTAAINALQPGMVLVVDGRDRLARDMLVSLTIHQRVKEKGATIEIADGSPSRATPEGNLMANVLDAFAQYDRERFARRTKAGLARKKERGEWLGKPPIGWKLDREKKRLVECPDEQKAVAFAVSLHKLGASSSKIALEIMTPECGYLCRGKPWSARTIRKILKREKHEK